MTATPIEPHLAEIIVLRLDLDGYCPPAVRIGNLFVRQFFKVCVLENLVERPDQIVVSDIALCAVGRGETGNLRTEIIIIVAQSIERLRIFVVTDCPQRARKTPKQFAFCGVREIALFDQGTKKVFLAHRNEFIPLAATRGGSVVAFEFDVHGVLETNVAA